MGDMRRYSKVFEDLCVLEVFVETNCPQGGDSGHGGRTILRFVNHASTDLSVSVDDEETRKTDSVEIVFGGDAENRVLKEALVFALESLDA